MTIKLSPHKYSKILRLYFAGVPQVKIATKVGVDQGSVSHYASEFKERTSQIGILGAAKEFAVHQEVDELRSLSVELSKVGLTAVDARQGYLIMKAFIALGIEPEQHTVLIKVCKAVADPGFVQTAIKLKNIELEMGRPYHQIMADLEKAVNRLPVLENQLANTKSQITSADASLAQKKKALADQEKSFIQYQQNANAKVTNIHQGLATKMKELNLKETEIEQAAELKKKLSEEGLDLETLIMLVKEFHHGKNNG